MGLKFSSCDFDSFLWMGVTSAVFHTSGNSSAWSDLLNIVVRHGVISLLISLRTLGLSLSGPEALLGFRLFRIFCTEASVMRKLSRMCSGMGGSSRSGSSCRFKFAIEEKNSLNHVAFSLSSLDALSPRISGGL